MFRCNLPPAFMCHCRNTGMERTPNKSQHTNLTLEKNILLPLLRRFELATFRSRVRCFFQQAILALHRPGCRYPPFKSCTGRRQWLLIQVVFRFLLFTFLCARYTWCYCCPTDACETGPGPPLILSTRKLFSRSNAK